MNGNVCRWLPVIAAAICITISCSSDPAESYDIPERCPVVLKVENGSDVDVMDEGMTVGAFFVSKDNGSVLRRNEMMIVGEHGMLMQDRDTIVPLKLDSYDFIAYSPYDSSWDNLPESMVEFDVEEDQSSDIAYISSDLMISTSISISNGTAEAVFRHAMSRIMLHITDKTGVFDMRFSSAVINDMKLRSYLYIYGESSSTDDKMIGDIVCRRLDCKDRRASFTAVFPAQQPVDGKLTVEAEIAGIIYDFEITGVPAMESGNVLVCSMSMTERGLELENTELTDWEDGGSGSIVVYE